VDDPGKNNVKRLLSPSVGTSDIPTDGDERPGADPDERRRSTRPPDPAESELDQLRGGGTLAPSTLAPMRPVPIRVATGVEFRLVIV